MTAVLSGDVVTTPKRLHRPSMGAGGDPLVDAAARLLSIPLCQVYAVLWRIGLIEVRV